MKEIKGYSSIGYFFLPVILLMMFNALSAQSQRLNFKYLTIREGLSHDGVFCIYQDRDGFMWFGTEQGIDRYDGRNIKKSRDIVGDTTGAFNQTAITILEDSDHTMWFSNDTNGIFLFDKRKLKYAILKNDPEKPQSIAHNNVRKIFEDSHKNIWIATLGGGLNKFNRQDSTFSHFRYDSADATSIGSDFITSIAEDHKGMLWLVSPDGLLIRFDPVSRKFMNIKVTQGFRFFFNRFNTPLVHVDSEDHVWFISTQGLYRYNQLDKSLRPYALELKGSKQPFSFVTSILEIEKSVFLITTYNKGLFVLNTESGSIHNYSHNPANPYGINSNRLSCIFQSSEGVIWIGSFDNGINTYSQHLNRFPSLKNLVGIEFMGLSNYSTYALCEIPNGKVWMATDGGIIEYDPQNGTLQQIIPELQSATAFDLFKDMSQNIWISTMRNGLFKYDWTLKQLKKIDHYPENQALLIDRNIFKVIEDHQNRLWIGYMRDGVAMYDKTMRTLVKFKQQIDDSTSLSNNSVYKLYEDRRGQIWVGTENGLNLFNPQNNSFFRIPFRKIIGIDFKSVKVNDIFEDSKNRIWIGTDIALFLYNAESNACISIQNKDHDGSFSVNNILEDYNNLLWLATNSGISRFDPVTGFFNDFGLSDGLDCLSFNPASGMQKADGYLYFGSLKGVTVFNPNNVKDDTVASPLLITGISVNNIPVTMGSEHSILSKPIEYTEYLELNYRQTTFSLEFAALNYHNPENLQYAYMLKGYNKDWIKSGNAGVAHYANLPPGKYIFKVTLINDQGLLKDSEKEMMIVIKPPFWLTLWFKAIVILMVASLIMLMYFNWVHGLQRQKVLLEDLVKQRTRALHEANLALTDQHEELKQQHEEISTQNEMLSRMGDEILQQNAELEQHRSHLQKLVEERTRELELAKVKAEESDRLKSAFLANMSHEIRTPMNAIVGFANLLKDQNLNAAEQVEFIEIINANSEILLVLIDDILDLSLIEANQLVIRNEIMSLNEILDHLYSSFSMMNRKKELEIRLNNELHHLNLKINSDRIRIKQVLSNLMNNAYKFTEKGFIELGLRKHEEQLIFYVRDTGIGIAKNDLDKIFERFRKSDTEGRTFTRGTGLGLAISRALAQLLGGHLNVESTIGHGSEFSLYLPFTRLTSAEPATKESTAHKDLKKWTGIDMLVVEDEQANYWYVKKMLGKMEVHVHWAENGLEAVKLASSGIHFQVILMDIKMPVLDGYEATKVIKANNPNQVVIALTAYARPEDREHFMKAGFDDYLSKPIKPNDFMGVIRRYINR